MIVYETATHQVTVEFKLLQVPLWPSTMNQSPYQNGSCKRPRVTKANFTDMALISTYLFK